MDFRGGEGQRSHHAQLLMDEDRLIPPDTCIKNVIESVSGICNIYQRASKSSMYSSAHSAIIGVDHQTSRPQQVTKHASNNEDHMQAKFLGWGIDPKWVVLFPHVDDFNGRDAGQNFLGCVSRTVIDSSSDPSLREGYVAMQRQSMTFCQCKVHEDTLVRQVCVGDINEGMRCWSTSLPSHRKTNGIKRLARSVHRNMDRDEITYRAAHQNKCMYYSIMSSDQRQVTEFFQLGLLRQVEVWACLIYCNGPDKHHAFFSFLLTQRELGSDVIPSQFVDYCIDTLGGSVMSEGAGRRHRPHWMKPYLKAEMNYGI